MITTRDFVQACKDAMITADTILPGRPNPRAKLAGHVIVAKIAEKHGISSAEILGRSSKRHIAWPRQEAYAVIRDQLEWSLPRIGRLFNRDHTTVMYGIQQHKWRTGA